MVTYLRSELQVHISSAGHDKGWVLTAVSLSEEHGVIFIGPYEGDSVSIVSHTKLQLLLHNRPLRHTRSQCLLLMCLTNTLFMQFLSIPHLPMGGIPCSFRVEMHGQDHYDLQADYG